MVDGAEYGDPMSGIWQVGIVAQRRLEFFVEGEAHGHDVGTLGGRYSQCGIRPAGDPRGIVDTVEIPRSVGLEAWIRDEKGHRRLSVNRCMRLLSLNDVRSSRWKWPLC